MSDPVDRALVHQLDLCVVAYQLYNQSLIFPLDPWYEAWARPGSDRRNNLMAALHRNSRVGADYWGPGVAAGRGWQTNTALDPILSDYRQIDPARASVTYDGEEHRLFAPAPFVDRIGDVYVASYEADRSPRLDRVAGSAVRPTPEEQPAAPDVLYAFEGATGGVKGRPPAWSLMGFVLAETRGSGDDTESDDGGEYDLHIVYRGSQSGWAIRSALWGLVLEAGNADWVTDMEMIRLVEDPRVASEGAVVEGIRNAMVESVGSLGKCLAHIHATRGAPATIQLTGHSLGGALAIQLAAGLTMGTVVSALPAEVQSWPWRQLQLTTFGAPKALDTTAAAEFDRRVDAGRVWLDGDPLVGSPLYAHVGAAIELQLDGVSGGDAHRPDHIWHALTGEAGGLWESYAGLGQVIAAGVDRGLRVEDLLSPRLVSDVDLLIDAGAESIGDRSSYRIGFTKSTRELAERAARLRGVFADHADSVGELEALLTRLPGVQPDSDLEGHLQQVLTIRETLRNGWTYEQVAHLLDSTVSS